MSADPWVPPEAVVENTRADLDARKPPAERVTDNWPACLLGLSMMSISCLLVMLLAGIAWNTAALGAAGLWVFWALFLVLVDYDMAAAGRHGR
jgi:hypothetical protein